MKTKLLSCLLVATLLLSLQIHSTCIANDRISNAEFNEPPIALECDGPDGVMIQ